MMDDRDRLITNMAIVRDNIDSVRSYLDDIDSRLLKVERAYESILGEDAPIDTLYSDLMTSILNQDYAARFDDPPETFDDVILDNDDEFSIYWSAYYAADCPCDYCKRYESLKRCTECTCNAPDYRMD
jgi:hypothetical protein